MFVLSEENRTRETFKERIDDDETHKRTSSEVQYSMRENYEQLPVIEIGSNSKEDGEKI